MTLELSHNLGIDTSKWFRNLKENLFKEVGWLKIENILWEAAADGAQHGTAGQAIWDRKNKK